MKKYYQLGLAAMILLGSCKKTDHQILITGHDFPVSIGSWWKYQVRDQDNVVIDTFTYTILDVANYNNLPHQRWVITSDVYSFIHDTIYVQVTDSSIGFASYTINLPIVDNQSWTQTPQQGVSYTTGMQSITVSRGTYNNATYLHKYLPRVAGIYYDESLWIVKDIGIVKHIINNFDQTYLNEQLISYHIN